MKKANRIKRARLTAGLSQQQLAEEVNVHAHSVSRWEHGVLPHPYHQKLLCKVLNVSPNELGFLDNLNTENAS